MALKPPFIACRGALSHRHAIFGIVAKYNTLLQLGDESRVTGCTCG
jgi:hypothetical protein